MPEDHAHALRILLVDDHAIVREGIAAVLEDQPDLMVVAECASGDEALAQCQATRPDVVLLDLNMPGLPAVDTIVGLLRLRPSLRVLVFTSHADDALVRAVLDAGAIGFLFKDALREDLLRALRAVAAGQPWLAQQAQRQLLELLRRGPDPLAALTPRETSVLKLLGRGCSNKQIARELDLTEGTVKGYVSLILDKLGVQDRTQAAVVAVRAGVV